MWCWGHLVCHGDLYGVMTMGAPVGHGDHGMVMGASVG